MLTSVSPERMSIRYEYDEEARRASGFKDSTYKTIFDRLEHEGSDVRAHSFPIHNRLFLPDLFLGTTKLCAKDASLTTNRGNVCSLRTSSITFFLLMENLLKLPLHCCLRDEVLAQRPMATLEAIPRRPRGLYLSRMARAQSLAIRP